MNAVPCAVFKGPSLGFTKENRGTYILFATQVRANSGSPEQNNLRKDGTSARAMSAGAKCVRERSFQYAGNAKLPCWQHQHHQTLRNAPNEQKNMTNNFMKLPVNFVFLLLHS